MSNHTPVIVRGNTLGTTDDYRNAPTPGSDMHGAWTNKPHRLVYDLCAALEEQAAELARLRTLTQPKE